MNCQICLEKYNHFEYKPYTLYSCSHTICFKCLNSLVEQKCPKCRCLIKDKKPNFGLLELIPDIHAKLITYEKELNDFKNEFKLNYDVKQNETQAKLSQIRTKVNQQTDKLINAILEEQKKLLDQIDKLDACLRMEFKDLVLNEQQCVLDFKQELTKLKKNFNSEETIREIELKRDLFRKKLKQFDLIDLQVEFQLNKFVESQINIGLVGTVTKKIKNAEDYIPCVTSAENCVNKGNALRRVLKDANQSIKLYDKAIEINPNYYPAYYNKGIVLKSKKNLKESLECFNKVIELNPNFTNAYNYKGDILRQILNYEEALTCYDKAIELNSNDSNAYSNKAYALNELKNYEEAIKNYDKAIELNPSNSMLFNNKGYALKELNRLHEAVECFDKATKLDPNFQIADINKQKVLKLLYN